MRDESFPTQAVRWEEHPGRMWREAEQLKCSRDHAPCLPISVVIIPLPPACSAHGAAYAT